MLRTNLYACLLMCANSNARDSASICETIWAILGIGTKDALGFLEGLDFLLTPGHAFIVAHACVDALCLELDEFCDRANQDFRSCSQILLGIIIGSVSLVLKAHL